MSVLSRFSFSDLHGTFIFSVIRCIQIDLYLVMYVLSGSVVFTGICAKQMYWYLTMNVPLRWSCPLCCNFHEQLNIYTCIGLIIHVFVESSTAAERILRNAIFTIPPYQGSKSTVGYMGFLKCYQHCTVEKAMANYWAQRCLGNNWQPATAVSYKTCIIKLIIYANFLSSLSHPPVLSLPPGVSTNAWLPTVAWMSPWTSTQAYRSSRHSNNSSADRAKAWLAILCRRVRLTVFLYQVHRSVKWPFKKM